MDIRTRAIWILLFLACGFTVISFNLIQIQLVEHAKYWRMAIENHLHPETIPPKRGTIFDADGNILAQSQRVYDVHLDGGLEKDLNHLRAIADILGEPLESITSVLQPEEPRHHPRDGPGRRHDHRAPARPEAAQPDPRSARRTHLPEPRCSPATFSASSTTVRVTA